VSISRAEREGLVPPPYPRTSKINYPEVTYVISRRATSLTLVTRRRRYRRAEYMHHSRRCCKY